MLHAGGQVGQQRHRGRAGADQGNLGVPSEVRLLHRASNEGSRRFHNHELPDHLVTLLVPQLGVDNAALEPLLAGQRGPVRVLVAVVAHAAEQHVAGEHNAWSGDSEGFYLVCVLM